MSTALSQSMSALETIAFILPGPWGPIGSAALHMLGTSLDPNEADPDRPVMDAIKSGFSNLESYIAQNNIDTGNSIIADIKNWIGQTEKKSDLDSNPVSLGKVIDAIGSLDLPVSNLDVVASRIETRLAPSLANYEALRQAQISTLIALRVSVACIFNYRVLLQQKLVTLLLSAPEVADRATVVKEMQALQSYFTSLQAFIKQNMTDPGVIAEFGAKCDEMKKALVGRLGPVQKAGSFPGLFHGGDKEYYFYLDNAQPPVELDRRYNDYSDSMANQAGVPVWRLDRDRQAEVTALRAARIARLEKDCDAFAKEALDVLITAQSIMADTKGDPAPPLAAPEVDYGVDTGWKGAWQFVGRYVRYSVLFQGPTRNSLASPFSDWHLCQGEDSCCPSITLPADPTGLALARLIQRDVIDHPGGKDVESYIVPVPNMTDDSFVDLCPVNDGDACPNAPIAPVLMYANYNADNPGRTWPDPYRVHYRYCYTRTIAGKAQQSLAWSPWSVAASPDDGGLDFEGYYYNKSYYSAQMLVPAIAGCGYLLQRQFKSGPIKVIKSRLAPAAQAGMMFLADDEGP